MARNWPRDKQRKYREARRNQAALVADRLLGKKVVTPDPLNFSAYEEYFKTSSYFLNIATSSPRSSIIISGMEGV